MNKQEFNRYLNKQPKQFKARTYPELATACNLKMNIEKLKNINRSLDSIIEHYRNNPAELSVFNINASATFGTADGKGWFNKTEAITIFLQTLQHATEEFAWFYITLWIPDKKLWISLSEIK